jgi:hypothetical protein
MKEIKDTVLYCICENFCESIYYSSGSAKAKSYGSYSSVSGSATMLQEYLKLTLILKLIYHTYLFRRWKSLSSEDKEKYKEKAKAAKTENYEVN